MHDTHSADVQPAASHLFPQCDGLGRDMLSEELSTDMDRITQVSRHIVSYAIVDMCQGNLC
jgi:hypothetical protein